MRKITWSLLFMFLLGLVWSSQGIADTDTRGDERLDLNLGLGAAVSSNPYRGADSEVKPFPLVIYEGEHFFVRVTEFGYHLWKQERFTLSLLGSYRFDGYESGDSSYLQGMADRDGTLEAGLQATFSTSLGQFSASLLSDVLDEHNGHEAKLTLGRRYPVQKFVFSPSLSVIWQSGQLSNHYYGVRGAEATLNRPAYKVDSSMLLRAALMTTYMLDKDWTLSGLISVTGLDDEIRDSPIVEDSLVATAFVGISYRF